VTWTSNIADVTVRLLKGVGIIAGVAIMVLLYVAPFWLFEYAPVLVGPIVLIYLGVTVVRGLCWFEREYLAPRERAQKAERAKASEPPNNALERTEVERGPRLAAARASVPGRST